MKLETVEDRVFKCMESKIYAREDILRKDRECIKQTLLQTIQNLLNTVALTHTDQNGYEYALADTKNAINKIL